MTISHPFTKKYLQFDSILEQLTGDDIIDRLKRRIQSGALRAYMKMPEKDDIDCQEMPELFHDYYGIKINKDYSGIDVKHPNDIEKHYSGKPKILFDNGNYQPKTGVFDMFEANTHCQLDTDSKLQYLVIHELSSISFMGSEKSTPELIHVDGTSEKALDLWIRSIEQELGRDIEQNKTIAKYNVDGYDDKTNTVSSTDAFFMVVIGDTSLMILPIDGSFTFKDILSYLSPNTSQYLTVHPWTSS
ncbi:hypothetical protein BATDEDRAFT_27582 [Batrachochytrium dendrobatidis JAM81]|uniref:Uncharacterized protein n=1 Tax=Batrachochytrium dendrobatidis (strain JAM81 / FGSC 10211) TaxID=684364 RepID=F4PBA7_BATDJ|nr:uncharacterized protein BATDEDRAFT_27582 [Batrachochytrium dendrobatidis JAM81]EGF77292.1 hypothetical protein BATDEDRAFT_27582 [Batrachochytrium dendrobatidis JAM81]|eukprot:XP_006681911.1 hypothetical protein BATDEDRAFT_27582 [Batrachochytrium dendrobatidis JAM81]